MVVSSPSLCRWNSGTRRDLLIRGKARGKTRLDEAERRFSKPWHSVGRHHIWCTVGKMPDYLAIAGKQERAPRNDRESGGAYDLVIRLVENGRSFCRTSRRNAKAVHYDWRTIRIHGQNRYRR
jgi:hypothetical protein